MSTYLNSSQLIPTHLNSCQLISTYHNLSELISTHLNLAWLISTDLNSCQLMSTYLNPSQLISSHLNSSQLVSTQVSSSPICLNLSQGISAGDILCSVSCVVVIFQVGCFTVSEIYVLLILRIRASSRIGDPEVWSRKVEGHFSISIYTVGRERNGNGSERHLHGGFWPGSQPTCSASETESELVSQEVFLLTCLSLSEGHCDSDWTSWFYFPGWAELSIVSNKTCNWTAFASICERW